MYFLIISKINETISTKEKIGCLHKKIPCLKNKLVLTALFPALCVPLQYRFPPTMLTYMIQFRAIKRSLVPDNTMADYINNLPARYNNSKAERIAAYLTHQYSDLQCGSHPNHMVEMNIESKSEQGDLVLYNYSKSCCDTFTKKINDIISKSKELFP